MGGWVQVSLRFFVLENHPKIALICWSSVPLCVPFVYTLIKVVSYYDLRVLSMSVMGFQKSLDGGALSRFIFEFFLNLQSL